MPGTTRSLLGLVPFLLAVAAVSATGSRFRPGEWYAALTLPAWTPPAWVFPVAWTLLYLAIAVAGWLLWRLRGPGSGVGRTLWLLQLLLNGLWSWLFFGQHWVGVALLDLGGLVATVALLTVWSWSRCRWAAGLLLPYLAWLLYAKSLNAAILLLNPGV